MQAVLHPNLAVKMAAVDVHHRHATATQLAEMLACGGNLHKFVYEILSILTVRDLVRQQMQVEEEEEEEARLRKQRMQEGASSDAHDSFDVPMAATFNLESLHLFVPIELPEALTTGTHTPPAVAPPNHASQLELCSICVSYSHSVWKRACKALVNSCSTFGAL